MNESGPYTVRDLIFNCNQDPEHNAIECPGHQPLTYRGLRSQIIYVVKTLNSLGFHRNERIAVIMPAGPETAVIIISVMAGFTVVPMNPQSREQEYDSYFSRMAIRAIIVQKGHDTAATGVAKSRFIPIIELIPHSGFAGIFDLIPGKGPDIKEAEFATPSDTAILLLTSGSTGTQKIVPLTQKQFLLTKQRNKEISKITKTDRALHILPYYHGMGLALSLLVTLLAGGTVICTKDFISSDFLPLVKTYRPTYFAAGPALLKAILREIKKAPQDELKNTSLRAIRTGSAPRFDTTNQELGEVLGVPVIEGYASSEAGMIAVNIPPREGSVGIPLIESLTIRDKNGNILSSGETGEIVVKGGSVFSGYENAPEDNKAVLTDGWFWTGDMGYLDSDGYLYLTGRKKELINKAGEKISPEEIDSVLKGHPDVMDAMAFVIPDPVLGEDIAAMVVPADAHVTEPELRRYLLDRLVPFKVPRKIFFVDGIPKTPTGKPIREEGTHRYSDK
jgi:acyl-CoA synthetase (AMP-forming)/AMP-acid ligase II